MPVRSTTVDVVREELDCWCGARMECIKQLFSNPPAFVYLCAECGKHETLRTKYPRLLYLDRKGAPNDPGEIDQ